MTTTTKAKPKATSKAKPKAKAKKAIVTAGAFDYEAIREADADRLRKYADRLAAAGGEAVKNFIAMGEQLYLARSLCQQRAEESSENGRAYNFSAWCDDQKIPRGTAYRYIAAHETFGGTALLKYASPSAVYVLCSGSATPEARKAAVKMADAGKPIDERAARELIAKHKAEPATPRIAGPTIDDVLTVPAEASADAVVIDAKTEDSCPSGGSHRWENDGHGRVFCNRCHAEYSKKVFGAGIPRETRKDIQKTLDKLARQLQAAGVLERIRAEVSALASAFAKL